MQHLSSLGAVNSYVDSSFCSCGGGGGAARCLLGSPVAEGGAGLGSLVLLGLRLSRFLVTSELVKLDWAESDCVDACERRFRWEDDDVLCLVSLRRASTPLMTLEA